MFTKELSYTGLTFSIVILVVSLVWFLSAMNFIDFVFPFLPFVFFLIALCSVIFFWKSACYCCYVEKPKKK